MGKELHEIVENIVEKLSEESCGNNLFGGNIYSVIMPDDDAPVKCIDFNYTLDGDKLKYRSHINTEWIQDGVSKSCNIVYNGEKQDVSLEYKDVTEQEAMSLMKDIKKYISDKAFYCTPTDLVGSTAGMAYPCINNIAIIRITSD